MNEKNIPLIIQTLEKQLWERIEKLWRVFIWTSNIQIAITAGIFFLAKRAN
jgi:hypothetical protein